jgi:hypothetical protein
VGGIKWEVEMGCRKDLKYPSTAVGGISLLWRAYLLT